MEKMENFDKILKEFPEPKQKEKVLKYLLLTFLLATIITVPVTMALKEYFSVDDCAPIVKKWKDLVTIIEYRMDKENQKIKESGDGERAVNLFSSSTEPGYDSLLNFIRLSKDSIETNKH